MNEKKHKRPIDVLIVDDNPEAALIVRQALEDNKLIREINEAHDGIEALSYLRREGPHQEAPRPSLIFLDLKMPKLSGLNVLKTIKGDENLKDIPVIIMTSSASDKDLLDCYREHANSYVQKPLDFDESIDCLKNIVHFWTTIATLPEPKEARP